MKRVNRKILSAAARRGFTMAEAAVAMVIVSVLLVAALRATSASALTQYKTAEKATGLALAQGLMSDIIALPYQEPSGTPNFGLETGESATNRANYDDVDDYNGWNQSPPQDKSGTVIPGLTGWTQIVAVAWVRNKLPKIVPWPSCCWPREFWTKPRPNGSPTIKSANRDWAVTR